MNFPGFGDLRQENGKKQQIIRLHNLQLAQLIKGVWMKAEPAFSRNATFVPPEQVMTRLMRREDERRRYWLDYLILLVSAAGILLGLFLAIRVGAGGPV